MERTLTTNEAAAVGALAGGTIGVAVTMSMLFAILMIIAMWKIFSKAGEKGWKALIPIYNVYIYFKIAGASGWFWGMLGASIVLAVLSGVAQGAGWVVTDASGRVTVFTNSFYPIVAVAVAIFNLVANIIQSAKLSRAFKRGLGTTLGLIFLPCIFQLILAFGSAKYDKKTLKH